MAYRYANSKKEATNYLKKMGFKGTAILERVYGEHKYNVILKPSKKSRFRG